MLDNTTPFFRKSKGGRKEGKRGREEGRKEGGKEKEERKKKGGKEGRGEREDGRSNKGTALYM